MAGTPDNRIPGAGGPETTAQETLTPDIVNGLRDRYLQTRGLEGARQFHIGYNDGRFEDFTSTPEGDAWSLVVRTAGAQFSRYDLGILPEPGPFAKTTQPTAPEPITGIAAAFGFKNFLDEKYPQAEPETQGTPDGHAPANIARIPADTRLIDPEDADRLFTARAEQKSH